MRESAIISSVPATIGLLFGGLWAGVAAMALPDGWHIPVALPAGLATIVMVLRLRRRPAVSGRVGTLFDRQPYRVAVIAEVAAILLASYLLRRFGLRACFLQVVGVIVGLHFIGLWAATRSRTFLGIAAGMCAASMLALLLPVALRDIHIRDLATGAGNAIVLWWGVARTRRRPPSAPA